MYPVSQLIDVRPSPAFCCYKQCIDEINKIWVCISQGSGRKQFWNSEGWNDETYERGSFPEVWAGLRSHPWMLRNWQQEEAVTTPRTEGANGATGASGEQVHKGRPPSRSCVFPETSQRIEGAGKQKYLHHSLCLPCNLLPVLSISQTQPRRPDGKGHRWP